MSTLSQLPSLVRKTFIAAQESGDLTFYETQVSILQCNGFPIRFSPALANKPKPNKPKDPAKKPVDPFENPTGGLFLAELPSHNIVLNKFPIIPNHFILATKVFKQQTDLLEEDDLGAAYACLSAYKESGEELFGFFNSGELSGASQPHRHLQFIPVESMRSGIEAGKSWEALADSLKTPAAGKVAPIRLQASLMSIDLPFAYFSSQIPHRASPRIIRDIYTALYKSASHLATGSTPSNGSEAMISYNLGLTDRIMVLCPRKSEGKAVRNSDGKEVGSVSPNGSFLGGTMLVKSEAEWEILRNDESKLDEILGAIGFPRAKDNYEEKL